MLQVKTNNNHRRSTCDRTSYQFIFLYLSLLMFTLSTKITLLAEAYLNVTVILYDAFSI